MVSRLTGIVAVRLAAMETTSAGSADLGQALPATSVISTWAGLASAGLSTAALTRGAGERNVFAMWTPESDTMLVMLALFWRTRGACTTYHGDGD